MSSIRFHEDTIDSKEVLRITSKGIWANPDIATDEAAAAVLGAIANQIKTMVAAAVLAEREACARVCDEMGPPGPLHCAADFAWTIGCHDCGEAIRARGQV